MFNWFRNSTSDTDFRSKLFDEKTFYGALFRDIESAKSEIIIESPFLNRYRVLQLLPYFRNLVGRGVKVVVITRAQYFYSRDEMAEIETLICQMEVVGVEVILTINGDHRKIAIIDRKILWEGSLNILSHRTSREVMRRIGSEKYAREMFDFLNFNNLI